MVFFADDAPDAALLLTCSALPLPAKMCLSSYTEVVLVIYDSGSVQNRASSLYVGPHRHQHGHCEFPLVKARTAMPLPAQVCSLRTKLDWYFIAEQPAPAPHLAHPEGCAALRIALVTVPRLPLLLHPPLVLPAPVCLSLYTKVFSMMHDCGSVSE